MEGFPRISLIKPEIVPDLVKESVADGQPIMHPTHVITLNNEIVGSFSLGNFPMLGLWLHTVKMKNRPRDSFSLIQSAINIMEGAGYPGLYMPIPRCSPFHKMMEHMGFTKMGETEIFYMKLR